MPTINGLIQEIKKENQIKEYNENYRTGLLIVSIGKMLGGGDMKVEDIIGEPPIFIQKNADVSSAEVKKDNFEESIEAAKAHGLKVKEE